MNLDMPAMLIYALFILALLSLWQARWPWSWAYFSVTAVLLGWYYALINTTGLAVLSILLLACTGLQPRLLQAGAMVSRRERRLHYFSFTVVFLIPLLLLGKIIDGFQNPRLVDPFYLGNASQSMSIGFSYQASLIACLILFFAVKPTLQERLPWRQVLLTSLLTLIALLAVIMPLAMALDYTRWDPKWDYRFLPWSLNQIFATCIGEEVFFRGLLQRQIIVLLTPVKYAAYLGIAVTAVIFGMAHGGGVLSLLAVIAGLGYGYVYHKTKSIEAAVAVHYLFNSVHFLLFAYPR